MNIRPSLSAIIVLLLVSFVVLSAAPAAEGQGDEEPTPVPPPPPPAQPVGGADDESSETNDEPPDVTSTGEQGRTVESRQEATSETTTTVFRDCAKWQATVTVTSDDPVDVLPGGGDPDPAAADPETEPQADPVCEIEWYCYSERIDEILTGEISGELPKRYAEYVQELGEVVQRFINSFDPYEDWNIDDPETFASFAEALASGGLGEQSSPREMPLFYYCLFGAGGPMYNGFNLPDPAAVVAGLDVNPDFGWDTDVETEYDLVTTRIDLVDRATAALWGRDQELTAIPPLDQGYSIVKFPMWLWLDNPVEEYFVHAYSDPATVRVSLAAVFDRIEWNMDGAIITCTLDDMRPYEGGDPHDNVPPCSHTFEELVDYELTATVFYNIYERISYRGSETIPWPDNLYVVHPTTPVLEVDINEGPMSVHQLVSLNVNEEQSPD